MVHSFSAADCFFLWFYFRKKNANITNSNSISKLIYIPNFIRIGQWESVKIWGGGVGISEKIANVSIANTIPKWIYIANFIYIGQGESVENLVEHWWWIDWLTALQPKIANLRLHNFFLRGISTRGLKYVLLVQWISRPIRYLSNLG